MYTSTSSTDPRLAIARNSVGQILQKLTKLIGAAAHKSGWSEADSESMGRCAVMEYFASLSPENLPNRPSTEHW